MLLTITKSYKKVSFKKNVFNKTETKASLTTFSSVAFRLQRNLDLKKQRNKFCSRNRKN